MAHYHALCASLPMLKIDDAPLISSETFLSYCSSFVKPEKLQELASATLAPDRAPEKRKTLLERYAAWEMSLRLSLAKLRANRLGADTSGNRFFKMDISYETDADRAAAEAYGAPNPLEREKLLDLARWRKLEELEQGHLFDFDTLGAYRCKLLIAEKWQKRASGIASENLDRAASAVGKSGHTAQ